MHAEEIITLNISVRKRDKSMEKQLVEKKNAVLSNERKYGRSHCQTQQCTLISIYEEVDKKETETYEFVDNIPSKDVAPATMVALVVQNMA